MERQRDSDPRHAVAIDDGRRRSSLSLLISDGGLSFFLASMAVNAGNFGFHLIMSRLLGPSTYGALGSLLGLINVSTVAVGALQAVVVQCVASRQSGPGRPPSIRLGPAVRKAAIAGGACLAASAVFSVPLASYLHLSSGVPVVELGVYVAISVVTVIPLGVLMGRLRFSTVAFGTVAGAVVRIASGPILAAAGAGLSGAIGASVLSGVVMLAIFTWPLRSELRVSDGAEPLEIHAGTAVLGMLAMSGISAFMGVDTFFVRHYLPPAQSGFYTAAATAARAVLFLPGAVASLAFPRFVAHKEYGAQSRRLLLQALIATGIMSAVGAAVIAAFPRLVIGVLFGSRFDEGTVVIGILAVAAFWSGLAMVLVYYQLSRRSWLAPMGWVAALGAVGAIVLAPHTMIAVAWSMFAITGSVTLVLTLGTAERRLIGSPFRHQPQSTGGGIRDAGGPELSIVIPYYNPGPRLASTVGQLVQVLHEAGTEFEVIAVSDGSTDGSDSELDDLGVAQVHNVKLSANMGKGQALRTGLSMASGEYLGFIDADGDIPPSHVAEFLSVIRTEHPDIIIGSKRHPDSSVVYPPIRRLYSWGYQQLIRGMFRLSVRDTQTGLKFIRREVLTGVLPRMIEKRFAFDLELLVVARHLGHNRIVEAPVTIGERFTSTVSIHAVWKMILDTLAIFYRLHFLRYYDLEHAEPSFETSESMRPGVTDRVVA